MHCPSLETEAKKLVHEVCHNWLTAETERFRKELAAYLDDLKTSVAKMIERASESRGCDCGELGR
jgi:hypothetical protein